MSWSRRAWLASAAASTGLAPFGPTAHAAGPAPSAPAGTGATLPRWASEARSGTWVQVPMAASLADVDPQKSARLNPRHPAAAEWADNLLRQRSVVDAWCGATYDTETDTMWLGLGGGHRDYAGNEVYACRFSDARPAWRMVRAPSGAVGNELTTNDGQEASGLYADGRPRATHGYNKWVFVPGVGPALMHHGVTSWASNGGKTWAVFIDPNHGEHAFTSAPTELSIDRSDGTAACWDQNRRAIWVFEKNTSAAVRYELPEAGPAHEGRYRRVGASWSRLGFVSACPLPAHDVILLCQRHTQGLHHRLEVFDCSTGRVYQPPVRGEPAAGVALGTVQPRWVPELGAACLWNNRQETATITTLTPGRDPREDPWTFGTLPLAASGGVAPAPAASNGTFGRWTHAPRLGGFLVFSSTAGPTSFYKI